jgi:4-hydroxy-2-oxoheptanedioate aldolase
MILHFAQRAKQCHSFGMTMIPSEAGFGKQDILTPSGSVAGHQHAYIGFALDAGASIVVPQVETVEQAREIVSSAKFGARINGSRSVPPARLFPYLSDQKIDSKLTLQENVNNQAAIIIQIESVKGVDNLDAILSEPNVADYIDAVWIGSMDCRVSMGLEGFQGDEPEWLAVFARYMAVLRKHNKPSSGLAMGTREQIRKLAEGKCFVVTAADYLHLLAGFVELPGMREYLPRMDFSTKASEVSKK